MDLSFVDTLFCSSLSGLVASFITTPLDLAKLRLQVSRGQLSSNLKKSNLPNLPNNTWNMLKHIFKQEGFKHLFRGAGARIMFHVPSTMITISTFEWFKKQLDDQPIFNPS